MGNNKYIADFVKVVYPESTELCMTINSEKECLQDATILINQLRAENARLRNVLERIAVHDEDWEGQVARQALKEDIHATGVHRNA